ncbi:MAG TPA: TetR family transcriptional regulator C-terminal domain-containing protein [Stellaceae bacterium]
MRRDSTKDVRERLLEAGVATFHRLGFNGCSVQDITEAAGVPKGSFYNHFESKEALGAAALEHFWQDGACDRLQILSEPGRAPRERLRAYFEQAAAEMAALDYTCGCLVGNLAAELSDQSKLVSAQLSTIFASWARRVADCIREAQAAGEISTAGDPETLANFVLSAWEGAVQRARIEKTGRPLQQFLDVLFTHLLR